MGIPYEVILFDGRMKKLVIRKCTGLGACEKMKVQKFGIFLWAVAQYFTLRYRDENNYLVL